MSAKILLESRQLVKRFGGILATDHVDFKLPAGARHALIGPNGAGKTTFVNLLSGVLTPTSGEIFLDGVNVTGWSSRRRAHAGMARTFQINQLFADLTPLETLVLTIAERENAGWSWFRPVGSRGDFVDEAMGLLRQLGIEDIAHGRVGVLAYGRQRLLEIAVALALNPRILLLDEPLEGLAPIIVDELLAALRRIIVEERMAAIIVEQSARKILPLTERAIILDRGTIAHEGPSPELAGDAVRLASLLGVAGKPGAGTAH